MDEVSTPARAETSLVKKLVRDIADPAIGVSAILRTAKIIATRLGQDEALAWINAELNGYTKQRSDDLPEYRRLNGTLRAWHPHSGWLPIHLPNSKMKRALSQAPIGSPIGEIEDGLSGNAQHFAFAHSPEINEQIWKSIGVQTTVQVQYGRSRLFGIVEAVRNLVLDWALKLEQAGVLGEQMDFTVEERKEAATVTHQIFVQNAGVVGTVSGEATVTNTQTASVTIDLAAVRSIVKQARDVFDALPDDTQTEAEPLLAEIVNEIDKPEPDCNAVRGMLGSLRTVCEGAAGNLAATGIVGLISGMLG